MKQFLLFFVLQAINYGTLTWNFRAIATANYAGALISDTIAASLMFLIIRHIALGKNSWGGWAGFVVGSVTGTYTAMVLTI
jgi:hypothetical protein